MSEAIYISSNHTLVGQHHKRLITVVSRSDAHDIFVCRVNFNVIEPAFWQTFFLPYQITSEKHLISLQMKQIIKKLKINYQVGLVGVGRALLSQ